MNEQSLLKVAWRPFWTYTQEESGTKIHLIRKDKTTKCLCGKDNGQTHNGIWGENPASFQYCKRCWRIARKHLSKEQIVNLEWF